MGRGNKKAKHDFGKGPNDGTTTSTKEHIQKKLKKKKRQKNKEKMAQKPIKQATQDSGWLDLEPVAGALRNEEKEWVLVDMQEGEARFTEELATTTTTATQALDPNNKQT